MYVCVLTQPCPTLCNPMHCIRQAPLSIEFFRQEYWSGLLFPPPGDLPHPGVQSESLASPALTGRLFTTEPPGKTNKCILNFANEMGLLQILKSIKIDVCHWNTLTSREYVTQKSLSYSKSDVNLKILRLLPFSFSAATNLFWSFFFFFKCKVWWNWLMVDVEMSCLKPGEAEKLPE